MQNSAENIEKKKPPNKYWVNLKKVWAEVKPDLVKIKNRLISRFPGITPYKNKIKQNRTYKKISMFYDSHPNWFTRKKVIITILIVSAGVIVHFIPWKYLLMGSQSVTAVEVTEETVPVYLNYVGTTSSVRLVDIRARVEGFLVERAFIEGDFVKEGDLMYVIDPREYEAALEKAKGQLLMDEAQLAFANEEVERYKILVEKDYVTQEFFDQKVTAAKEAAAAVDSSRAQVDSAKLNLGYCRMYSPLDGQVGRTFVHVGNLVGAAGQDTKLATVVQLDPIYVYFSPSDQEYRKIVDYKKKGKLSVTLKFDDGTAYPYQGEVDFANNVVETGTSTVKMRAVIRNPDQILLPGVYVDVNLYVAEESGTLLVPEQALAEDQGGPYVLVVDKDKKVSERSVVTGASYQGMRTIKKGLKKGEYVIVEGMQLVKPGQKVDSKIVSIKEIQGKAGKEEEK